MYISILAFHNIIRWVVVIGGALAIGRAWMGWLGKKQWTPLDDQFGLIFTMGMDVQILLGLILYFVLSPITTGAFGDMGAAMSDSGTRFFVVEHIAMMILGLGLAHVGRSRSKKGTDDTTKYKMAAIFYTLAVLFVLAGIPWARPLLPLMS